MSNVVDWRESGTHFFIIVVPISGKGVVKQVFLLNLLLKYVMIMAGEDSNPGPSVQTWRSRVRSSQFESHLNNLLRLQPGHFAVFELLM